MREGDKSAQTSGRRGDRAGRLRFYGDRYGAEIRAACGWMDDTWLPGSKRVRDAEMRLPGDTKGGHRKVSGPRGMDVGEHGFKP